jgi:tRNA (guanine37-N1)-methyltransferase
VRFYLLTVLPDFFGTVFHYGIVGRAVKKGLIDVRVINLRDFTEDAHRTVDDRPFGGGAGMVLKPEPIDRALDLIRREEQERKNRIVLLSAQGKVFRQEDAQRWAQLDSLTLICGRYEGVDERVASHMSDEEIGIGDFVLSGGEPAALVIADAMIRLLPGVLGNSESTTTDSFTEGILGYPQYTRPADYRHWKVPEILISGDHQKIRQWRKEKAIEKTREMRPELLSGLQ